MSSSNARLTHIQLKQTVGVDVAIDQRSQGTIIFRLQPIKQLLIRQDALNHQGVDVDQGDLEEV